KQQRALVLPIDYFDPEIAEKLHQEATRVAIEGTHKVEEKLLEMGVSRKDPFLLFNSITDDLSLTEIHWDLKTSHLVSLDIVDRVDINNLSLSYLGSKDKT
ncbi:MAG: hypothetical protein Q8P80_05050, partial [Candidatus Levybacteria bacterium]|nr:hypothetical protein [Candidatus Levybacteria bacterium]